MTIDTTSLPVIAVSACLLGEKVRFDGGHKCDNYLTQQLQPFVSFRTYCPEAAIGMGIPRPPIRLTGDVENPQAVGVKDSSQNFTLRLEKYATETAPQLTTIAGYIWKKGSPSCGMERVKVYPSATERAIPKGIGVYSKVIQQHYPVLPMEEEGRLQDWVLRENFLLRVYTLHRWQQLQHQGITKKELLNFHTKHKYIVMSHSQAAYQRLGQLLSQLKNSDISQLASDYIHELLFAMQRKVTRKRHSNVLLHIMGYLKKSIATADKEELLQIIDQYRQGELPLIVPITMLRHYFRLYPDPYMLQQYYLNPYPASLGLRNNI